MTHPSSAVQTVADAHAQLRRHDEIQFDLPHLPAKPPEWHGGLPALDFLFWPLVIIGAALVLFLVGRTLYARFAERRPKTETTPEQEIAQWRPEEGAARTLLAEADAMAGAGRFDEAARLLLHRSLQDIAARRPRLLRPALTSREIARVPALPDAVRGAFAAMAAPVERSLFGGRALGRADWEEARAAYGAFALPGAWR